MTIKTSSLNIAIVGINLSDMLYIRDHLTPKALGNIKINWINLAETEVDVLITTVDVIKNEKIKRFVTGQNIHIVFVSPNHVKQQDHVHDILSLPLNQSAMDALAQSIQKFLSQTKVSVVTEKPMDKFLEKHKFEVSNLFDHPEQYLEISDEHGLVGIVDTELELVWSARDLKQLAETVNRWCISDTGVHIQENHIGELEAVIAQDSRQWLWRILWQSAHTLRDVMRVNDDELVRLKYWAQPDVQDSEHNLIFRLCAYFQLGGTLSDACLQLEIPRLKVEHFLSACLRADFAEKVATTTTLPAIPRQSTPMIQMVGSFFQKMKKHLGL